MNLAGFVNDHLPKGAVHGIRKTYRNCSPDAAKTRKCLKRQLKTAHGGSFPIKVAFVVQMPEVWDKQAPVFERMLSDRRFEPHILVAPAYDFVKKEVMAEENPDFAWYAERYEPQAVGGATSEASGAASEASGAAGEASGAVSEASGATMSEASGAASEASGAAGEASDAASEASGAASEASGAAGEASGAVSEASGAAGEASGAAGEESRPQAHIVEHYPGDAFFPDYNASAGYEYVFYDRPYDEYFPAGLKTGAVMQAAKIAMINYCTAEWEMDDFEYYQFGRHTTIWFASNNVEAANFRKGYLQKPWRKAYDVGYPAFEYYRSAASENRFARFLWTPRWSTDEDGMGSNHFFAYIDELIRYFSAHPGLSLVIRPHPLMFDNFVSKGIMSGEEIAALKERCAAAGITFDANRMILDTFRETDILLTDYSSVIGLFMVSGKPVIYCPTGEVGTEEFNRLSAEMYRAESWEEVEKYLNCLTDRDDPLEEERRKVVDELLLSKKNAAGKILEILVRSRR